MQKFWTALALVFVCVLTLPVAVSAAPVYSNSLGMEFVRIPAGSFVMGDDSGDSAPAHMVTINKPFYLGKYEVTKEQWAELTKGKLSQSEGDSHPVAHLSWDDVQAFIQILNDREETDKYRLPTEAEWEYAARAGTQSTYIFGEDLADTVFHAWYNFNSGGICHPVGMKRVNAFGLHDMQGNVSEWVNDLYDAAYYSQSPLEDPKGPATGQRRVARGCNWRDEASMCASALRLNFEPSERNGFTGFRLLREVE